MTDDDLEVVHNPQKSRFELEQDGLFCVLEYHLVEGKIVFTHTEVPEALGGAAWGRGWCVPAWTMPAGRG